MNFLSIYPWHTAVTFADRIDTPLLLVTGTEDHNVPERCIEAEIRDYHERIRTRLERDIWTATVR